MKHSPAPRRIVRASEYTGDPEDTKIQEILAADDKLILYTDDGYFQPPEANARLIAAAPELLEALTHILSEYDAPNTLNDTTFRTARAAIAKATGEPT
jgi:hypothetical protein